MRRDIEVLRALMLRTLTEPQAAARELIEMRLPMQVRWLGFGIVLALSGMITVGIFMYAARGFDEATRAALPSPLLFTLSQAVVLLIMAFGIARVGGLFGGRGNFADALLLLMWLEFLHLCFQIVLIGLSPLLGTLGAILTWAEIIVMIWLLTRFVTELHQQFSPVKVFFALIGGFFILGMAALIVLSALGIAPALEGGLAGV